MDLMRIIINENSDQHIIFLKEVDGDRMFPIVIGIFEATSGHHSSWVLAPPSA